MTGREALLGSSFSLTGERDGAGGTLALRGRAARSSFAGEDGTLSLDGDVTTAMLGADYARDRWLAGLALARSRGEGGYAHAGSGNGFVAYPIASTLLRIGGRVGGRRALP